MHDFLDDREALDARRFFFTVRKLADSLGYGSDHSPFLGAGIEFVQSRLYQSGDPIKAIDWRVTARTGKFHIKEYESPKRLPVYILLDTSASMAIRSGPKSKYALAVQIAAAIALASLNRVSPVGLLGVGQRELFIRPSLAKSQILEWYHQLRSFRYDEQTTLRKRILELAPTLHQRSVIFVLSDLHDQNVIAALKRIAQNHDLVVLQFVDPAEAGLPRAGFLRAREAETKREYVSRAKRAGLDPTALDPQLKQAGIDHLRIHTDAPSLHELRQFLAARDQIGRGAR